MKTNYNVLKIVAIALLFTCNSWGQITLAQWNFNGADAASVPGGGSNPLPVIGSGTIGLIGSVSTSATPFASGNSTATNPSSSSDPITNTTNLAWAITNYPALGTGNKTSGIQINVNTANYAGISLKFDQRLSNKAGNTYVVQYTTDRLAASPIWIDAQTFTFTPGASQVTGDVWYNSRTVDLSAISGLNNNDMPAFRIVAAFDLVTGNYLASTSTSTYDGLGVTRFDMVTVTAATSLSVSAFEQNQNKFIVTPNPVRNNMIYFKEISNITIYDVTGKNVLQANNVKELNVSSLHSGVYLVKNKEGNVIKLVKE
jgi:hypothetical protein